MSKKPVESEVCYRCPVCGKLLQIKQEGRTEGSISDCKACGTSLVNKSVFIAKIEEEIKEEEK
jgi:transposase-like protein